MLHTQHPHMATSLTVNLSDSLLQQPIIDYRLPPSWRQDRMSDLITTLSEHSFDDFVKNNDCVVVFFKSKCPNCKVLLKVMEKVKAATPTITMACVSSEEEESVAKEFDISRVPTVLIYKDGMEKARRTGILKPVELEALYNNA